MAAPNYSIAVPQIGDRASGDWLGVDRGSAAGERQPAAVAPEQQPPVPVRRLLVLVPEEVIEETALARQVWSAAVGNGLEVLYLGLCRDFGGEATARRRLVTLAALTRDNRMQVVAHLAIGRDWLDLLRAHQQPGDLIVCHAEQQVTRRGRGQPLSQFLTERLDSPVRTLSGYCVEASRSRRAYLERLAAWTVPVAIVVAFLWLQVQIQQLARDWLSSSALIVSVLVEFTLILVWHHFSN